MSSPSPPEPASDPDSWDSWPHWEFTEVPVYRALRVLLVTTGTKSWSPAARWAPARSTTQRHPAGVVHAPGRPRRHPDRDFDRTARRNSSACCAGTLRTVDLVVTTGGVCKGAYEVVRQAMEGHGVEFLAVAVQPGGPQGIGTFDGVPVLGFPGKPGEFALSPSKCSSGPRSETCSAHPRRGRWPGRGWPGR